MSGPISTDFTAEEKIQLDELEVKHGRVFPFRVTGHGLIVLRRPLRPEWRKYQNEIRRPQTDIMIADENFAKLLTLVPDAQGLDKVLDEFPGLIDVFMDCIRMLAVGNTSEVAVLGKDWKEPDATT